MRSKISVCSSFLNETRRADPLTSSRWARLNGKEAKTVALRSICRFSTVCWTPTGTPFTTSVPMPYEPVRYGICCSAAPQSQRCVRFS